MSLENNIIDKIIWQIKNPHYYKGRKTKDLIILDDYFPNPVNGFRITEFLEILEQIPSSKIIIDPVSYKYFAVSLSDFDVHLKDFFNRYPEFKNRVIRVKRFNNINANLFYFIFLNNGRRIVTHLNRRKINFMFTLYPGGGFKMNDEESDRDLKKIMSSNYFKGVIVNQQIIKNYLLQKRFCLENQIHYLHGIPMTPKKLDFNSTDKEYFKNKKEYLDICFVAAKYLEKGIDKGYDLFIEVALALYKSHTFLRFHVIGGFNNEEIDVSELGDTIRFYGYLDAEKLPDTLKKFDIILSPNRPNMLGPGSFDGFPLGSLVEASLVGCVIIATDELNENKQYIENEEIIIIKPKIEDIIIQIENLIATPNKIKQIGVAGMNKSKELFSYKNQIEPRIKLLKSFINQE
jgi:glycosyltransferase involved in cell wall biosynthesis